jgi:hypothetical protein
MKKTITRFFLFTGVVLALCGCSTMSPGDTFVLNKANEYLRTGATRDPDEAIRMAREFYREVALKAMEASQKNQDMNSAIKEQQEKQRQLDSWSATNAPR